MGIEFCKLVLLIELLLLILFLFLFFFKIKKRMNKLQQPEQLQKEIEKAHR